MPSELIPMRWPDGWSGGGMPPASPFNCLLVEGTQSGAPVEQGLRVLTSPPPETHLLDGVAPGIKVSRRADGSVEAGPTGKPWIDANGWKIEMVRALHPGKAIWVDHESGRDLLLSVADAAAYGARWVATMPRVLAEGIEKKEAASLTAWKRLETAVRFFEEHAAWRSFENAAAVGLLSDFGQDVTFLAEEFLNLAARRPLPVRVVTADSFAGLRCVVHLDSKPPSAARRDALLRFAESGGLVLTSHAIAPAADGAVEQGYSIVRHGKGRIARPKDTWSDPYQLAADAHLILTREHDVLRLYNGTSLNVHYTRNRGGTRGVVHLLNYAGRPGTHPVTVALAKRWKRARLLQFHKIEAADVQTVRYGIEIPLPDFDTYLAIELEA